MIFALSGLPGRRLGGLLGRLGGLLGPLGRFLGPSWPSRGLRGVAKAHAEHRKSAQERPGAPGKPGVRALKNLTTPYPSGLHEPWDTPLRAEGTVADLTYLWEYVGEHRGPSC